MMPQLGETVTEGTVTRWMKGVGDSVERDEPLFEVSTDKVDSEVPSPASGTLTEILVPEGETVEVGVKLAVIGDGSTGDAPAAAPIVEAAAAPAPAPAPPAAPETAAAAPPPQARAPAPAPPPVATDPGTSPATEPSGAPLGERGDGADGAITSPMVRRLLSDNEIDRSEVTGTGPGGRITRDDVLREVDARRSATAAAPAPRPPAPSTAPPPPPAAGSSPVRGPASPTLPRAGDQLVPFSNVRRRTAEHMVRSKATSPHAFIAKEVDFEAVERVRSSWGERFRSEEGFSLTYLPFVARASVEALRDFPLLNASVVDDALLVHADVNLGIAVDLAHEGLIVPVVHRAEELTLRGIARRIRELADRARTRKLTTDDISGGTFSITNDGPFGTYFTVPIINQPQVAILATDGIARRPVVVTLPDGSESIAIHSTGVVGLSWDHRAVDGAYVSLFLARVAELIGSRDWAAEL
jgi:pyruvate dehydrogenase E2 component (dihydrolipoamide acetyltransferase)